MRIIEPSFKRLRANLGELGRAFAMLALLRPAADYLPKRWALDLARIIGYATATLSLRGWKERQTMKRVFGQRAGRIAREWITRPYLDYVAIRRLVRGREVVSDWQIYERNLVGVEALRRSGASFIVATGHFAREATAGLYRVGTMPQKLVALVAPLAAPTRQPQAIRIRAQYGNFLDVLTVINPELQMLYVGQPAANHVALQRLSEPGNVVITAADAPWPRDRRGGHARPFAGHRHRAFATGLAHLSRLSQCPVVVCVPYIESDGRLFLDWSDPIAPSETRDKAGDLRTTNTILDIVEKAIGRRPGQYVLDIGGDRCWSPSEARWAEPGKTAEF